MTPPSGRGHSGDAWSVAQTLVEVDEDFVAMAVDVTIARKINDTDDVMAMHIVDGAAFWGRCDPATHLPTAFRLPMDVYEALRAAMVGHAGHRALDGLLSDVAQTIATTTRFTPDPDTKDDPA